MAAVLRERACRPIIGAIVTAMALLSLLLAPSARAADLPPVSLTYVVTPGGYNNTVRVGNVTDMLYPRIAIDRGPTSPYRGTIYVLGLDPQDVRGCLPIVVARSHDVGRTFERPRRTDVLCVTGPSLSVGIDREGAVYVAGWGPIVARSSDGGLSWTVVAILGNDTAPASLAVDPVTDAIHVVWAPLDKPWHDPRDNASGPIRSSESRDRGGNWSAPVDILPVSVAGGRPHVAAWSDSVVVAFRELGPTDLRVSAVASQDGGQRWGNVTAIAPPDPCGRWADPSIGLSPSGLFGVSWAAETGALGCSATWGNATETWASVSGDAGRTFSAPAKAGGPPGWIGAGFGGAVAFDDASSLFVAWRSITASWTGTVYVANSTDLRNFESASFTIRLRESGGNSTASENLAAGLNGTVYLAWTVVDPLLGPDNPVTGIFVRSLAGGASGDLAVSADLGPGPIDLEFRDPTTNVSRARVQWTGPPVSVPELQAGIYDVWLVAGAGSARAGAIPIRTWGLTSFTLSVGIGGGGPAFPWTIPVSIAVGIALVGAALASLHYTRIGREQVLQRKVRLLMYEHVRDNPGASFTAVRDAMGLKNGVAAYHLGVLETQGLLHSESRRRHRWYYTNGAASMWKDLPLSPLQSSIIEAVRGSPGIGIRELGRALGRRSSPVAYNVKMLAREGILRLERAGHKVHCYLAG